MRCSKTGSGPKVDLGLHFIRCFNESDSKSDGLTVVCLDYLTEPSVHHIYSVLVPEMLGCFNEHGSQVVKPNFSLLVCSGLQKLEGSLDYTVNGHYHHSLAPHCDNR